MYDIFTTFVFLNLVLKIISMHSLLLEDGNTRVSDQQVRCLIVTALQLRKHLASCAKKKETVLYSLDCFLKFWVDLE